MRNCKILLKRDAIRTSLAHYNSRIRGLNNAEFNSIHTRDVKYAYLTTNKLQVPKSSRATSGIKVGLRWVSKNYYVSFIRADVNLSLTRSIAQEDYSMSELRIRWRLPTPSKTELVSSGVARHCSLYI